MADTKKTTTKATTKKNAKTVGANKSIEQKSKPAAKKPKRASGRKTNLLQLCLEMTKMSADAVDREVCRNFRIIIDACREDITKISLTQLLKDPLSAVPSSFDEAVQPYIKHYVFMSKRKANAAKGSK